MSRPPFLSRIVQGWYGAIEDYDRHHILSERTLQASLWAQLRSRAQSQFIFIEPRVTIPGRAGALIPDILVCRGRSVIAVIELKFRPRGSPNLRSDMDKLLLMRRASKPVTVKLDRFLGMTAKDHRYKTTERTQYVLGYVSKREPRGLSAVIHEIGSSPLRGRCAILSARTAEGRKTEADHQRL